MAPPGIVTLRVGALSSHVPFLVVRRFFGSPSGSPLKRGSYTNIRDATGTLPFNFKNRSFLEGMAPSPEFSLRIPGIGHFGSTEMPGHKKSC
jgi:hypothetical protein